jgi:hypothetical protein
VKNILVSHIANSFESRTPGALKINSDENVLIFSTKHCSHTNNLHAEAGAMTPAVATQAWTVKIEIVAE